MKCLHKVELWGQVVLVLLLLRFSATRTFFAGVLAAPNDRCTVLVYTDMQSEPSSMRDTSSTCPIDGGTRAFILDMKPDGRGHPVLKEASPTASNQFACLPGGTCKVAVTGYGLKEGDHLLYFRLPAGVAEPSSLCPPPLRVRGEVGTVESTRRIRTGSSAVFEHRDLPLAEMTVVTVFNLGEDLSPNSEYVMCYASSLALRGQTPRAEDFRYFAGVLNTRPSLSKCDFEEGTTESCGLMTYQNNADMDLPWEVHSGPTETAGTGPEFDHTKGPADRSGKYLYMKSPGYAAGSTATMMTQPAIYSQGTYCARFAFHMFGDDVNSLRVYVHEMVHDRDITGDWGQPSWLRVGDHGKEWQDGGFEFTSDGSTVTQLVFEALAGFSEKGDIAIDDLEVFSGKCPVELLRKGYNSDYICGEVRLVSGEWSADKSWFIEGAVSCAGRGYSYDQLRGGWVPCCVPSYGEYTVVLKDQFGDGWGGSKVEFRFFDEVMTFGEDFDKEAGREKKYKMNIGLLKIVRAEGSENRIGLEVSVMLPQAHLYCGAAVAGSKAPTVEILKRYGIRSKEQTGVNGGTIRLAIQNAERDGPKMLKANRNYDVYCYAASPAANLGSAIFGESSIRGRSVMDDLQVKMSKVTVSTDGTEPGLTLSSVDPTEEGIDVDFFVTEEATVWCAAFEMKDGLKEPAVSQIKEEGFRKYVSEATAQRGAINSLRIRKLMPDTRYMFYCYAEDVAQPEPNGFSRSQIAATARELLIPAKIPNVKIMGYKTFARGFSITVKMDTPGKVWCGAAMTGSPYPKKEDVRRVGASAEVSDISRTVDLEIRGVPPNSRYTVYCVASSRSGTREMTDAQMWETALEVGSFGKFCELPTEPRTIGEGDPTPFDPITPTEEFLVRDYITGRKELRLDGVYRITLFTDKDAIVNYYDNGGPFPLRYARVRVGTCQMGEGHYDQYKVGPLDSGNQEDMTYEKIARTVITDCGGYTPTGVYGRRLLDVHHDDKLSSLLKSSFGYPFGNQPECRDMTQKKCLEFGPVIYEKRDGENHSHTWVGLKTPENHHVPFYFVFNSPKVDMSDPTEKHRIRSYLNHHLEDVAGYWYDGKTYDDFPTLLAAYEVKPEIRVTPEILAARRLQAEAVMEKRRKLEQEEEAEKAATRAARRRRLAPGPNPHGRGDLEYRVVPEHIEPQGKRFTVRQSPAVESYTVKYAGWEFTINNDRDTSLRLWNVKFNGDRIAFEMGLMEALAHYSVAERNWYFLDSWYGGLGSAARKLHRGVECPRTGETIFWDESVCIFEQDLARPLRSHWKSGELRDGAPHTSLVVRQMLTVSNYDYITDWTFHLSGTFEGTVAFTGELYAGVEVPWFSSRQAHFGTQVTGSMRMGALHNHFAVWKIDFDVDGDHKDNSVYFKEVVPDPVRPGAHMVKDWFAEREMDAAWRFNGTRPLHYFVVNEDHRTYGNVGGYFIKPGQTIAIPQPEFEVYSGPAAWTKYRVFSHVRKDGELDATLPRDNKYASRPATDIDRYIEDNEIIRHRDVVTWVSDGVWHLPHVEDMPLTVALGNTLGWMVKPANFYAEDPSMDLHNAIAGDIKDPGTCAVIRSDIRIAS